MLWLNVWFLRTTDLVASVLPCSEVFFLPGRRRYRPVLLLVLVHLLMLLLVLLRPLIQLEVLFLVRQCHKQLWRVCLVVFLLFSIVALEYLLLLAKI